MAGLTKRGIYSTPSGLIDVVLQSNVPAESSTGVTIEIQPLSQTRIEEKIDDSGLTADQKAFFKSVLTYSGGELDIDAFNEAIQTNPLLAENAQLFQGIITEIKNEVEDLKDATNLLITNTDVYNSFDAGDKTELSTTFSESTSTVNKINTDTDQAFDNAAEQRIAQDLIINGDRAIFASALIEQALRESGTVATNTSYKETLVQFISENFGITEAEASDIIDIVYFPTGTIGENKTFDQRVLIAVREIRENEDFLSTFPDNSFTIFNVMADTEYLDTTGVTQITWEELKETKLDEIPELKALNVNLESVKAEIMNKFIILAEDGVHIDIVATMAGFGETFRTELVIPLIDLVDKVFDKVDELVAYLDNNPNWRQELVDGRPLTAEEIVQLENLQMDKDNIKSDLNELKTSLTDFRDGITPTPAPPSPIEPPPAPPSPVPTDAPSEEPTEEPTESPPTPIEPPPEAPPEAPPESPPEAPPAGDDAPAPIGDDAPAPIGPPPSISPEEPLG